MRNWHVTTDEIPSRVFSMNVGHYLWGIDTSFFFELSDGTIDWSDITYEELTRISLVINEKWFSVISRTLPMRNWHASNNPVVVSRKNIFVGHYLWGIDTIHTIHSKAFIENFILSDITYEELTHAVTHFLQHSYDQEPAGRTLPMRNWHDDETYFKRRFRDNLKD